jgi:hypothetical protein
MLALIRQADLPKTMRDTVELAAEAAMLRRHMIFNIGLFLPVQLERSEQIMTTAGAMPDKYGKRIQAMCLLAMSQHALIGNDREAALELAKAAQERSYARTCSRPPTFTPSCVCRPVYSTLTA